MPRRRPAAGGDGESDTASFLRYKCQEMLRTSLVFLASIGLTSAFVPSAFSPTLRSAHGSAGTFFAERSQGSSAQIRRGNRLSKLTMKDFPKPNLEDTANYREAERLSQKFKQLNGAASPKTVAIIGGIDPDQDRFVCSSRPLLLIYLANCRRLVRIGGREVPC